MSSNTSKLLLTMPSVFACALSDDGNPASSWIQLARTGSFVSNRYGRFSITRDDLAQMLHNFKTVMPKPPTELPIDFDHLSMEAKKPGDGIAAGWIKELELRASGDQLWARTEWTPRAANAIRDREYRFISPSFVKDHTDSHSGAKIGTTLLAAALTNHPFLQAMNSVALVSEAITGQFAVHTTERTQRREAAVTYSLASVGDRVSFVPDKLKTPELEDGEREASYVVRAVKDGGDTQFVRLETIPDGNGKSVELGWFDTSVLQAAPAPNKAQNAPQPMDPVDPATVGELVAQPPNVRDPKKQPPPPLVPPPSDDPYQASDDANAQLVALSSQIASERGIPLREAVKLAGEQRADLVLLRDGHTPTLPGGKVSAPPTSVPVRNASPTLSLSASQRAVTNFYDLVVSLKADRHIGDLQAYDLAKVLRPDLAATYADSLA